MEFLAVERSFRGLEVRGALDKFVTSVLSKVFDERMLSSKSQNTSS
jgi:hypothetical protein